MRKILLLTLLTACGGAPAREPAPIAPTTGAENAPRAPTGPVQSFVGGDHRVVVRVDLTLVRESPVGADISSLIRAYPAWQELLGSSGIDPVRDFDRVVVAGTGSVTGRGVMVIRHHLDEADIRRRVLQMSVSQGESPEWRRERGFPVVDWPAPTDPPRVVVLSGAHEIVVTTADDLERVLDVAEDHRGRSEGDEIVEPGLLMDTDVLATIAAQDIDPSSIRFQYPPDAFTVIVRQENDGERMALVANATYADEGAATTARDYLSQQRDYYAGQMLVRMVGLDRVLREARIESAGNRLDLGASLTMEEMQRVLGLVALGQIGGS
jgi:hypothetical protein